MPLDSWPFRISYNLILVFFFSNKILIEREKQYLLHYANDHAGINAN